MRRLAATASLVVLVACSPPASEATGASATTSTSTSTSTTSASTTGTSTSGASATTSASTSGSSSTGEVCDDVDALYAKRIEPLLATERPKSCNQCHLSGIDLGSFVRETPCETMACLVDRGLVDLDAPNDSLILDWIARATPSGLVTEELIAEEYAGFLAWIEGAAACDGCGAIVDPCGEGTEPAPCGADEPPLEFDDPGGCEAKTREAVFRNKVYAWRDRCYPCHFSGKDQEPDAPKWISVGACELASLETMRAVEKSGYIDLSEANASLLLLKPLAEAEGGVMHGGHDKFADADDPSYVDFLYWLEREAKCAQEAPPP